MAGHYCVLHEQPYFKKGKMKGYAHPIGDEEGETIGWCNEEEVLEKSPSAKSTKEPARQSSTNESIESQVAFKGFIELIVAGVLLDNSKEYQTTLNWANSKLANWASVGEPPKTESKDEPPEVEPPTKEQGKRLTKALEGYDEKEAKDILIERWHTNTAKHLNKEQMEDFIAQLEKGKPEKAEPDDTIPF